MDTGFVDVKTFARKYQRASNTQYKIDWRHLFMGKISQEWIQLYKDTYVAPPLQDDTKKRKYVDGYIWGANVVETLIQQMIILWKTRNKVIHGEDDDDNERLKKKETY